MESGKRCNVYCLSGLGADHRIFADLNVPGYELVHLDWLLPRDPQETMNNYAARLAESIPEETPILMGVSFGGMMAIEIAKLKEAKAVVLISSIKSYRELPLWMKLLGKCRAEKLLPSVQMKSIKQLKTLRPIQNYFLGARSPEEKAIANEFRDNVDPIYLKWALHQIFTWKNDWHPQTIFHVHGARDKIFPISKVHPTHIIPEGRHFMVMGEAKSVSKVLTELLDSIDASRREL